MHHIMTLIIFFLTVWPATLAAQNADQTMFGYHTVSVLDGDTFIATDGNIKFRVRMAGLDAPERGEAYGKVATYRLKTLTQNKEVQITPVGKGYDRYGRVLGIVTIAGNDIALQMIKEGLAFYYRPTCKDYPTDKDKYNYDPRIYVEAEQSARQAKKNMWSREKVTYPCEYRRRK